MGRYVSCGDREQLSFLPICLDDMIAEDNVVRAIDAIVDNMDINSMKFTYSETKATGRKPYSPVDLFKLYTYSYFNGIRSSRKIEKECYRNIEVMWLINELKPDFKTIADFRKDNKKQIKLAFSKFSMICDELGLVSKEMVAVDGSKFRANNSRKAYYTKNKLDKMLNHYTEAAEKYITLLDVCDNQESYNQTITLSKAEIETKIKGITDRVSELQALAERVEKEGTIYMTDTDARLMRSNNGGGDISHNVQIAIEDKTHLIVAVDVTSESTDLRQLYNISSKAKEELQVDEITTIADKGYYCAEEFAKCKEAGITPIVSKPNKTSSPSSNYGKINFTYDEEKDIYICPQGQELSRFKTRRTNNENDIRYVNKKACLECTVKDLCTPHKNGRTVNRKKYDVYADEVDKRTKENADIYKKRQRLAEHPFGTIKRSLGFTYFLTRGTENVRTESLLHFLVYNIRRVVSTLGVERLVGQLNG